MIRPCQKNGRQEGSMLTEIFDRSCGCGFIVSTSPVEIRLRVAEARAYNIELWSLLESTY